MLQQSPSFGILAVRPETPFQTHELVQHFYNLRDHTAETLKQNEHKPGEEPKVSWLHDLKNITGQMNAGTMAII